MEKRRENAACMLSDSGAFIYYEGHYASVLPEHKNFEAIREAIKAQDYVTAIALANEEILLPFVEELEQLPAYMPDILTQDAQ